MPAASTTLPAPSTLTTALAELGLDVQLVVTRKDGQPLTPNDVAAVEAHTACADLEAGREVSDDQAAEAAARALAGVPAFAPTDKAPTSSAAE